MGCYLLGCYRHLDANGHFKFFLGEKSKELFLDLFIVLSYSSIESLEIFFFQQHGAKLALLFSSVPACQK